MKRELTDAEAERMARPVAASRGLSPEQVDKYWRDYLPEARAAWAASPDETPPLTEEERAVIERVRGLAKWRRSLNAYSPDARDLNALIALAERGRT